MTWQVGYITMDNFSINNEYNYKKNKLILLYAGIAVFIALIIVFIGYYNYNIPTQKSNNNNQPSITSVTYPPVQPSSTSVNKVLNIISTTPSQNEKNIPTNLGNIKLSFDQPVSVGDVPLSISPNLQYSITANDNSIIITPQSSLIPGITYSVVLRLYTIQGGINLYTLNFTTTGSTPTPMPTDSFNQQQDNNAQRQMAPDVYLSNYTPYTGSDFTISSSYNLSVHHYQFAVSLSGNNQTQDKQDFVNWLHSLQFTDSEIQSLDITYQ